MCNLGFALLMLSGCQSKPAPPASNAQPAANVKTPRDDLMAVPVELAGPVAATVSQAYIDTVVEKTPSASTDTERIFYARSDSPLWIRGWAYDEKAKKVPSRVWIELAGTRTQSRFFLPADRMQRPDVADGFKLPWARMSGFATAIINDHNIPRGEYQLKVYQIAGGSVELTKFYSVGAVTVIFE